MKKLMFAMAVTVCALGAQAACSYVIATDFNDDEFVKPSTAEKVTSYYTAYAHSFTDTSKVDKQGKSVFGVSASATVAETVEQLSKWFNDQAADGKWAEAKAAWLETSESSTAGAKVLNYDHASSEDGALVFARGEKGAIKNNSVVVFFYNDTVNAVEGFRVVAANDRTSGSTVSVTVNENDIENPSGVWGDWYETVNIPEPTSGLLMLLGMAGLALKRKRA